MPDRQTIFQRTELLLGRTVTAAMHRQRVLMVGVGGVGSWCAESLVRSGIGHLTLVDMDVVCESNVNRQLMATQSTIGQPKAEVLRKRLLDINPAADIVARCMAYDENTAGEFCLDDYDYVIDAIDTLKCKALLICRACESTATLFSSMGAALKLDPQRIRVAEFWKVEGDPLARTLRKRFKREGTFPARKFQCVYSDERLQNVEAQPQAEGGQTERRPNGTVAHITAIFGFTLASLVVRDVAARTTAARAENG